MYDVAIIGGGLHGGFTAWHLKRREPGLKVVVIERDPTYEHAASARSNAGVRVLFSQEENLRMSQYGHEVYGGFADLMAVDGVPQPLSFWRQGYLFIATEADHAADMAANHGLQTAMGAEADLIDAAELKRRFPSLYVDDVKSAVHAPKDGWIDPYGALTGVKRKNRALGVEYLEDVVVGLDSTDGKMTAARLESGGSIQAKWFVNTCGAWAREITRLAGFEIPVAPLPRNTFYFECHDEIEPMPLTIDARGGSFKPEGKGFVTGYTHFEWAGDFDWTVHEERFEQENWPLISHRVPAFQSVKLVSSWACHYALNEWDGNALLGAWPGQPENFLISTGYSGHGLQQAPAAGRALSELILDGGFQTLDLSRFAASRVAEGRKEPERGVKA